MAILGNFHQALDKYRETHEQFPESKEVLQYLVRLCSDMNMAKELKEYQSKLRKLEKMLKDREERSQRHPSATNARRTRDRAKRAESNNRLGSGRINSAKSGRELSAKSRGSGGSGSMGGNSGPNSLHRENSDFEKQINLDDMDQDLRPKTSSGKRMQELDDFDDDDLLPE